MSPSTLTESRPLARRPEHPLRPVTVQRPPLVIRPFAAPVVRELPPRRAAAGAAW